MPTLRLRIKFGPKGHIGPGKVELLELVAAHGSISAAARSMEMSYKHAWDLLEELNLLFGKPLLDTQAGGRRGGGAQLTPLGQSVINRFRAIELAANAAAEEHISALQAEVDAA